MVGVGGSGAGSTMNAHSKYPIDTAKYGDKGLMTFLQYQGVTVAWNQVLV